MTDDDLPSSNWIRSGLWYYTDILKKYFKCAKEYHDPNVGRIKKKWLGLKLWYYNRKYWRSRR